MVATDSKPSDYGEIFDTISVCFSKGLGHQLGLHLFVQKIMKKHLESEKFRWWDEQSGYLQQQQFMVLKIIGIN